MHNKPLACEMCPLQDPCPLTYGHLIRLCHSVSTLKERFRSMQYRRLSLEVSYAIFGVLSAVFRCLRQCQCIAEE